MIRTIYFAHDQQESPEARKHVLELSGYVVQLYPDYRTLMAALKAAAPSLVMIDALLEGKNGFETTSEISQRHSEREYPIILSSGIYRTRPFREEALKCGAQDYLLLPVAPDEFLRRINQAIAYFVPPEARQGAVGG